MTSSQLFKPSDFPNELLHTFLTNVCDARADGAPFIFNRDAFKRANLNNQIEGFLEECKQFYHKGKHYYLERKMTYNYFTTVLRQICNRNSITYTSNVRYCKSRYEITYLIHLPT
jgi:hypothetical protein